MTLICSISGEIPENPTASKYGHVYESSLIEKYVDEYGKDPVNGQPLTTQDLIPLNPSSTHSVNGNSEEMAAKKAAIRGVVKPRTPSSTSIPAMLRGFQDEWDALMLETFTLREQLQKAREELSHSLYQHDAACRVIARITRERDEAKSALQYIQAGGNTGEAAATSNAHGAANKRKEISSDADSGEKGSKSPVSKKSKTTAGSGLTEEVLSVLDSTAATLSKGRKKRPKPEGLADSTSIGRMATTKSAVNIFSGRRGSAGSVGRGPFVVCGDRSNSDIIAMSTGGSSGEADDVNIVSRATGKTTFTLKSIGAQITKLAVNSGEHQLLVGTATGSVQAWSISGIGGRTKTAKKPEFVSTVGSGPVSSISVHPSGKFVFATLLTGSWSILDANTGHVYITVDKDYYLTKVKPSASEKEADDMFSKGFTAGAVHPDGLIFATGDSSGTVRVWDVKDQNCVAHFDSSAPSSPSSSSFSPEISSLLFSENGFFMLFGSRQGVLSLCDLRKLSTVKVVEMEGSCGISQISLDGYGSYVAVGTSTGQIHVYMVNKQLDHITTASISTTSSSSATSSVQGAVLSANACEITAIDGEGLLHFLSCA